MRKTVFKFGFDALGVESVMKNVEDIVKSGLCIGCMACLSLCPFGTLDTENCKFGYLVPHKSTICNDCGLCLSGCPSACNEEDDYEE